MIEPNPNPRSSNPGLGGPRPPQPDHPSGPPEEAETGNASFPPACTAPDYSGIDDGRRAFELAHGQPNPRQRLQRGEKIVVPRAETKPGGPFVLGDTPD